MLIAGPLSDKVLEPAMQDPQSSLATSVGWAVGTGPGRGMALLFIIGGCLAALVALSGYVSRNLRDVDTLMPDHDTLPEVVPPDVRLPRLQELLEERNRLILQPASAERELALKSISNDLRRLGQGQPGLTD